MHADAKFTKNAAASVLDNQQRGRLGQEGTSLASKEADTGVCLPARMTASHRACISTKGSPDEGSGCARNDACMVPVLLHGDHMFKVGVQHLSMTQCHVSCHSKQHMGYFPVYRSNDVREEHA